MLSMSDSRSLPALLMTRAWRARSRYDDRRSSLRTWLFAIARNALVDHGRTVRVDLGDLLIHALTTGGIASQIAAIANLQRPAEVS